MEEYKKYKQKADQFIEKYRLYIALCLIIFVVLSGTVLIIQGANANNSANTIKSEDIKLSSPNKVTDDKEIKEVIFDIEGAVQTPGVYKLPAGKVLIDAINGAGGFSADADRDRIAREMNQASQIGDGSKIYIFKNSDKDVKVVSVGSNQNYSSISNSTSASSSSQQQGGAKINLNKSTLSELDTLSGIGPALAQRIIDWRDANGGFEVIEDMKKVKGIGDSVFDGLKNQITIE
jgi:competence protein ComEA